MIQVAILTRRLKEGKTYEDFRKAWYHTGGFGTGNKMYTVINVFDPREILVIGFTETTLEQFESELKDHPRFTEKKPTSKSLLEIFKRLQR